MTSSSLEKEEFAQKAENLVKKLGFHKLIQSDDLAEASKEPLSLEETLAIKMMMGDKEAVEGLLKLGADPEYVNNKNYSLLELAQNYENKEIISLIKEYTPKKTKPKPKSNP